jgi:exonuclease SbcC
MLRVTAFGAFGGAAEVNFDALADSGLFLLHGETGAGKTTLLDAIGFALYGQVPGERRKAKRLRSDHAAATTRTEVTLEATIGGHRFRVTRSPQQTRPKRSGGGMTAEPAKVLLAEHTGGSWQTLSTRTGEADQQIADLMGMSAEQFFQVVLLPQGQFARFLHADADERRALLQRLFRTEAFRAVEDWLAERRKETANRVRDAEQDIGLLAARIAQVAGVPMPGDGDGQAASPAGNTAAGTQPGGAQHQPGTAPALTTSWAEGLAATAAADRDAAARVAGARRGELDAALAAQAAVRVLADRQRRRAEALRRREELAADEARMAARRQELAAATRAAEIARVFTGADRAAEALAAARGAEEEGRAAVAGEGLSPQAPAGELRAAAEERQQQVGRLTQLRELADRASAEDELAAAARDRAAALAAGIRAGEEAAADQAVRREQLTGRREAARQASSRLPGVRDEAGRRRAAAGDAAALAEARAGERALHEQRETAREHANGLHERALKVREERIDGMIAELAAALVDGTPCPVCGSLDHPDPSEIRGRRITHHEEEQAALEADAAREAVAKLDRELAALGARASDLATQLIAAGVTDPALASGDGPAPAGVSGPAPADGDGGAPATAAGPLIAGPEAAARLHTLAAALAAEADTLETEAAQLDAEAAQLGQHENDLTGLGTAITEIEKQQGVLAGQRQSALDEGEAAERRAAGYRESLLGQLGGAPDLDTALAAAREAAVALAAAAAATEATAAAARDAERAGRDAGRAAAEAGFAGVAPARAAIRTPEWRATAQEEISAYEKETAAVGSQLADPELDVPLDPPADVTGAEERVTGARDAYDEAVSGHGRASDKAATLAGLVPESAARLTGIEPLREHAAEARQLADLAAGLGANTLKMTLSSFVLAARLEEVAEAASQRLLRMTAGRYSLAHTDARRGAGRSGLGLLACDAWTGQERDTSTLSGGETFLASLALALGLADVVTAEAAGVTIEALFVDEGFGSLDEDTLDEVMSVLDSLREGGRMVGIVSHVSELRQRIPAQVHVRKGRSGSSVELVTA